MKEFKNLDQQYVDLIKDIVENGDRIDSRNGGILSLLGTTLHSEVIAEHGFPIITTKYTHFKGIAAELLWYIQGSTKLSHLLDNGSMVWCGDAYTNYLKTWRNFLPQNDSQRRIRPNVCNDINEPEPFTMIEFIAAIKSDVLFREYFDNFGPIYGEQFTRPNSPSSKGQLIDTIDLLHKDPLTRRAVVDSWSPTELHRMVLPPCVFAFQFKAVEASDDLIDTYNKQRKSIYGDAVIPISYDYVLNITYFQRSADVPLGVPFNISTYALLLQIVAEILNMIPGKVIAMMNDSHIYENQLENLVPEIYDRFAHELPLLKLPIELISRIRNASNLRPEPFKQSIRDCFDDMSISDFELIGYKHSGKLNLPLSN